MTTNHSTDLSSIPRRFRERSFRLFELDIAAVLNAYPSVISINPRLKHNLSQETFAARFRDSMKSYAQYDWETKHIDRKRFMQVCNNISVSMPINNALVRIGDKDELKKPSLDVLNTARLPSITPVDILIELSGSDLELDLICRLAALRLLSCEIKCTGFTEQTKTKYEQKYDVSIELNPGSGIAGVI